MAVINSRAVENISFANSLMPGSSSPQYQSIYTPDWGLTTSVPAIFWWTSPIGFSNTEYLDINIFVQYSNDATNPTVFKRISKRIQAVIGVTSETDPTAVITSQTTTFSWASDTTNFPHTKIALVAVNDAVNNVHEFNLNLYAAASAGATSCYDIWYTVNDSWV